jgi:proline dehydrogenase
MGAETVRPAIATHDLDLVELTRELARDREEPFEFQMLYGVRSALQRRLVEDGFTLRVYLPFGSQWYPYLTRRLAERPANAWFFVRSLFGS